MPTTYLQEILQALGVPPEEYTIIVLPSQPQDDDEVIWELDVHDVPEVEYLYSVTEQGIITLGE